ncbi:MAG: NADH-quinone oxidoreductase subunit NuoF, partial [Planctomycetaceae bacterium]
MPTSPDFKPTPVLTKRIPEDRAQRKTVWFDQYVATGGYKTLEKVLSMQPGEITDQVKAAILRGRGGAGFPAGLKWSFLTPPDGGPRYLAINCDEAEPGTFKDRLLVDFDPHAVLEGIAIAAYACQMQTAYFFIRGEYHHQAKVFQKALEEAYANGIFGKQGLMRGASKFAVDVVLHRSAGAYICGEETALLEAIEGKRGWPRVKPPFPAIKGLFGRPTIINNVETLAAVVPIMEHGVEWWKKMGVESTLPGGMPSYGTKLMGVSGHVNKPNTYELELGIPLRMLVENHCGGMRNGKKFKGAIAGGVSMGVLGTDQYDAPMDFDIGRKYDVLGLGTACPTIFDEDTDMVAVARNICRFFKAESCGQCTPCREGSGWLLKLI